MSRIVFSNSSRISGSEASDTFTLDSDDDTFKEESKDKSTPKAAAKNSKNGNSVKQSKEVSASNSPSVTPSGVSTPVDKTPVVHEMVGVFKKESCCMICEEVSDKPVDLKCKGPCARSFHSFCLQLDPETINRAEWKCKECVEGESSFFDSDVVFK